MAPRSVALVSLEDLKQKATKKAATDAAKQRINPLPPKPKVAADEVAVITGNTWSVQKKADRNPALAAFLNQATGPADKSAWVSFCSPTSTTTTTTSSAGRGITEPLRRREQHPLLRKNRLAATTAKDTVPRCKLKWVAAGRVAKATDTYQCGGLRDDSKTRGKRYTVSRKLPAPTRWMALGQGKPI